MNVNINNLICISLKSHNDKQILAIAATYDIDYNALINLKSEGCQKIWIHKGAGFIVAGLDSSNIEDVYFSPNYLPMTAKVRNSVLKVTPVKTPKMPKAPRVVENKVENNVEVSNVTIDDLIAEFDVVLDVDTILDKITKKGMKSLTKVELDFLNNQ